jgi:hypothetical protein
VVVTASRQPAFFVGGGPLAGHSVVEIGADGRPPSLLRVLVTQGPLLRIQGKALSSGMRTFGVYQLSDDSDDRSLIYEFVGEEFE